MPTIYRPETAPQGMAIAYGTAAFVAARSSPYGSRRFPLQSAIAGGI